MKITLKSDETLFAGNVPVVVPAGTAVDFPGAETHDQLAGELAASTSLFAQFRDDLSHKETVRVGGETDPKEAVVGVVYGVGGQRIELSEEEFDRRTEEAARARATHAAPAEEAGDSAAEAVERARAAAEAEAARLAEEQRRQEEKKAEL